MLHIEIQYPDQECSIAIIQKLGVASLSVGNRALASMTLSFSKMPQSTTGMIKKNSFKLGYYYSLRMSYNLQHYSRRSCI